MGRRTLLLLFCATLLHGLRPFASSAPLPPTGKADIEGTIEKAVWEPAKRVKGVRGMSGSAGRDRIFPAHFVVTLTNYTGPTTKQAAMMNSFVGSAPSGENAGQRANKLVVWINSPDSKLLKPGMTIRIKGYSVSGDEGGTWTHHESIEILKAPP